MPLAGNKHFDVLCSSPPRLDGVEKVKGTARFVADMHMPGMLYGGALCAGIPSGRIISIDATAARAIPGVAVVLTPADMEKHISCAGHPYITDRPRFAGDVVALAAAESKSLVQQALAAIKVEYEEYEPIFTIEAALAPDAPAVRDEYPDNLFPDAEYHVRKGDVDRAFAACDIIIEREYQTQPVEHAYIEPEAALAYHNPADGQITVHVCAQAPYYVRRYVAELLGVHANEVRIVQETIGGTFGGKEDGVGMLAARTAYLSRHTGRPVKWVYTREDSIQKTAKRHPFTLRYKVGAAADGRILAWAGQQIANCGAYSNHSKFVNWRANVHCAGAYDIDNISIDTLGVFTNTNPGGAFRGYSSPQLIFAQEQLIDELAEALHMSEVELRRINRMKEGSRASTGAALSHVTLGEVMDFSLEQTDYCRKRREYQGQTSPLRRGIGMAISHRGCGFGAESPDASGALLIINEDGSVTVNCALTENGQGMRTVYCMIAAEALGLPLRLVRFYGGDTQTIADSGITAASRGTSLGAQSVRMAGTQLNLIMRTHAIELGFFTAEALREALGEEGELPRPLTAEDIVLRGGEFFYPGLPEYRVPFPQVCSACLWSGRQMSAFAWKRPQPFDHDMRNGCGQAFGNYAYGCVVAEVEVDMDTGYVEVLKVTASHDVGTAIHPELIKGQIYGGVVMGLGFGIMEEVEYRQGRISAANLDSYILPTALDMPEIQANIFESDDEYGTFESKSIGEPATEMVAAAIANAVYNATGRRIRHNPCSLENVLLGKKLR